MDIDELAKIAQKCIADNPVLVMGTGASIPYGVPGMAALQEHLIGDISPTPEEEAAWNDVTEALASGQHLEQALLENKVPNSLNRKIVSSTWLFLAHYDRALYFDIAVNNKDTAISKLLRLLSTSTHRRIDIVTTNYDRLIEYASNAVDLIANTGFFPGYIQKPDSGPPLTYSKQQQQIRQTKIWKVHGSLDWFRKPDGTTLAMPLHDSPHKNLEPLIVTPGANKYEITHEDPFRSVISGADSALNQASAFLCIGYGFRDSHIQPKLVDRCRSKHTPITILARTLTGEAKKFLRNQAGINYLGLEANGNDTVAYSQSYPDGFTFTDSQFWVLDDFLNLVT